MKFFAIAALLATTQGITLVKCDANDKQMADAIGQPLLPGCAPKKNPNTTAVSAHNYA
tara:strand:+ start:99 stop:272 length:174 start_codon:yes stop_codon:yes gene_type:complete